jgi:endoglucanase
MSHGDRPARVGVLQGLLRRTGVLALGLGTSALLGCSDSGAESVAPATNAFVHVEGDQLVDRSGTPFSLKGVTLGDLYYEGTDPPRESHGPEDYARIAAMGMNYVYLSMTARWLEDAQTDPGVVSAEAFAWLDDNVAWARANHVSLLLAMVAPPGGSTVDCGNDAFWASAEYQERWLALWRSLAARFAGEPTILGYAPLDPPNPDQSLDQWQTLAELATGTIREVDREHVLLVSRALSIACGFDKEADDSFVRIDDPNVVYGFDGLQPWFYVAQLITNLGTPTPTMLGAYGSYPDENLFTIDRTKATWLHASDDSRPSADALKLLPAETAWTQRTFYYTITDRQLKYAQPVFLGDNSAGKAYFDDILIEELSDAGERVVEDLDVESLGDWNLWEGDAATNTVHAGAVAKLEQDAHRGSASISLSGVTTPYANLGAADSLLFLVNFGSTYRVTSWVKGENVAADADFRVRLDLYGYSEALHGFDRSTLEEFVGKYRAWGRAEGVPMLVTSFGVARPSFGDGRGGLDWVSDMIDIMREQQVGFTYYGYHQRDWGIYSNAEGLPDPETVNQPLVDLLTEKLH